MKRGVLTLFVVTSLGFVVGCPLVPAPGPEAVLEGTWSITPADPGDFEGFTYEARFNSSGDLVEINGTRPDGATASLAINNATTTVDGSAVSISIPRLTGTRVFEGTLSDDQNTITGSITDEIDLGDLEVTLPGGDLTLERVVEGSDPCDGVTCDPGESCVDGMCVADDPCDDVTCDPGESCVDGMCVADDPCDGVTCDPGESCVDGICVP